MSIAEKLETIAENEIKVYEAGLAKGGYDKGYTDGKQAEYDAFWDRFQIYGRKTLYTAAFMGDGWNDENFKPKYDILANGKTYGAFHIFEGSHITNIKKSLEDCGVKLSFSGYKGAMTNAFTNSRTIALPELDLSSATALTFNYMMACKTIDKIICKEDGSNSWDFTGCNSLEYFDLQGKIGRNFNISAAANLNVECAKNIIKALMNYADDTANAYKYKVTFSSQTKTLLEAEGATAPNGYTWLEYAYSKGWNY